MQLFWGAGKDVGNALPSPLHLMDKVTEAQEGETAGFGGVRPTFSLFT
jgi:hypothetical protein